jgi:hypothetical protein
VLGFFVSAGQPAPTSVSCAPPKATLPQEAQLPGATDDFFARALHTVLALMDYLLKTVAVCQKQTKTVPEKPATSRLFNACRICPL